MKKAQILLYGIIGLYKKAVKYSLELNQIAMAKDNASKADLKDGK